MGSGPISAKPRGITDHGLLGGLGDDDHSQYAPAITIPRPKWGANIAFTVPGIDLTGGLTTHPPPADSLHYLPILLRKAKTFDRILLGVTSAAAAGTVARLGIYNADDDWQPSGAPVLDAGTVAVDSIGVKTIVINQICNPGAYLLAFLSDGAPQLRAWTVGGLNLALDPVTFPLQVLVYETRVAQAYGFLPDPGPAWTTTSNNQTGRAFVFLRESVP